MFPPSLPAGLIRLHRAHIPGHGVAVQPGQNPGDAAASFTPQSAPIPPDYATLQHSALGAPRSGVIPFNGRQLPLPPGEWQVIELGRSPSAAGAANVQVETFAQIKSRAIVGVLVALAPDPVLGGLPPPTFMQTCLAAGALAGQIAPPNPANPLANECWVLTGAVLTEAKDGAPGAVHLPELDRFRAAGLTVPEHVAAFDYRRSDQNGWLLATLFTVEPTFDSILGRRRLQLWAKSYAAALHRGFDTAPRTAG